MPSRSITDFRGQLVGSGARPNLFSVTIAFPTAWNIPSANTTISFMAESASLPADKIGEIEVGFMGRKVYYPGDREFDPWTINVYNDETFDIRDSFELWMSALNSHDGNIRDPAAALASAYSVNATVSQLSKIDGPAIKNYTMSGCFPTEVGAIELSWKEFNTIETFAVTLRYQDWNAIGPNGPTTDGVAASLAG